MSTHESCVVHEILADDAVGYQPAVQTSCGVDALRAVGLHIESTDNGMVVERLPGSDVYPASRRTSRLFTLKPGEIGRYRANFRFRFTTCACAPRWYYETWTVHVAYARPRPDLFLATAATRTWIIESICTAAASAVRHGRAWPEHAGNRLNTSLLVRATRLGIRPDRRRSGHPGMRARKVEGGWRKALGGVGGLQPYVDGGRALELDT